VAAVIDVVNQQACILGDPVGQLECSVAGLSQVKYAVDCVNDTDALLLVSRALDVGTGDDMVTSPFTIVVTARPIHNVGARPVFVDIDPLTFYIAPDAIRAAVGNKTKALIVVDSFWQMAAFEPINDAAQGRPVIEEAAQSIGASRLVEGVTVRASEPATIGTHSFFPSKSLGD